MVLQLKIVGVLLIILALGHIYFPYYFNWKKSLQSLDLLHREIFKVHTFFIAVVVLLMGLLCFFSAEELLGTSLGQKILLGMAIFWILRLLIQFFGYSRQHWKGKRFETFIHLLFASLWLYISSVLLYGAVR